MNQNHLKFKTYLNIIIHSFYIIVPIILLEYYLYSPIYFYSLGEEEINYNYYFNIESSPNMSQIVILHDKIFFYMVLIFVLISWFLFFTLIIFRIKKNIIPWTFLYPTQIEIIWTVIPILILAAIVIPSFNLLYAQDESINPSFTVRVVGFQWYWTIEVEAKSADIGASNSSPLIAGSDYEFAEANIGGVLGLGYKQGSDNAASGYVTPKDADEENMILLKRIASFEVENLEYYLKLSTRDTEIWPLRPADSVQHFTRLLLPTNIVDIPANEYVRILVTSNDVIHSFALPALGIKVDAVPGRLNQVTTYITKAGYYFGQCSEICGSHHGFMPIGIQAL